MFDPAKPLRVLVSEGSSTSAREAITILGLSGHHVEVCDPSPWCLSRFSRFVRKFHRCPGLRDDPAGYLAFVEQLSEVDVSGVEPMTSVTPMAMKKRSDVVTEGGDPGIILGNAPATEDNFFLVPKVVE